jgi:hypothetical protein
MALTLPPSTTISRPLWSLSVGEHRWAPRYLGAGELRGEAKAGEHPQHCGRPAQGLAPREVGLDPGKGGLRFARTAQARVD